MPRASASPVVAPPPPAVLRPWSPPLTAKGADTVNDLHRYLLLCGGKKSSKTFTLCHKVAKHLYDFDGARAAIVVKRKGSAAVGVWSHLTNDVIEGEWQRNGRVLPWVRRPGAASDTKAQMFSVRNGRGTNSYCHLFSLYNPKDAEEIFKNTAFSLIYVNEIDQFESPHVFRAMADQMRSTTVPYPSRQFIADCNPPEEGDAHWLYPLFIDPPEGSDPEYRKKFRYIFYTPQDNPFITEEERQEIYNGYKSDPDKLDRYWFGKWITATTGSLFEGYFDSQTHVVGLADAAEEEAKWQVLLPPAGTSEIFAAWDLGQTSHAVVICTKRWASGELVFDQVDEVVSVDMEIPLRDVVDRVMEKMDRWEKYLLATGAKKVRWRHWADTSSFKYLPHTDGTEEALVRQYSRDRIWFKRIKKPSIEFRIEMMKRLLGQKQYFVSVLCPATIAAFRLLKKGGLYTNLHRMSANQRRHTHPFDALTYGISHEMPMAVIERGNPSSGTVIQVQQK